VIKAVRPTKPEGEHRGLSAGRNVSEVGHVSISIDPLPCPDVHRAKWLSHIPC
jgi:hypothetical protein